MKTPEVGEFCWNELATPNVAAAKDFYGKAFGWQFSDHDVGDGMTYTMIKLKNNEFGGIWQIPSSKDEQIPPHWMSYILVEDIEETVKKIQSLGAKIAVPPKQAGKYGVLAVAIDPSGAHFALWQTLMK